jgi:hypothetical protein
MFKNKRKLIATSASRNTFVGKITSKFVIVGQNINKRAIVGWTGSKSMLTSREISKWSKKKS